MVCVGACVFGIAVGVTTTFGFICVVASKELSHVYDDVLQVGVYIGM